jgi:RNA polymerase sigma factor (sigma-70 family)
MSDLPMVRALPVALPVEAADRLAALFDAHHERLYRLARRLAPGADDALDLVQETYLKAARSMRSVPAGAPNQEAWLVRVLINIRRDEWRKTAVRRRNHEALCRVTDVDMGQEGALMARTTVWRALDTLTPRRRAIVVMHELEGLSISAIAALLGISAITVRWHLSVGRRDLARAIQFPS